jgi:preprotein translocase subunit SecF
MFWFSVSLVLASILVLGVYGLNLGVDFRGGSVIELVINQNKQSLEEMKKLLIDNGFSEVIISYTGDNGVIIRTKTLSETEHQNLLSIFKDNYSAEEKRFDSIGPVIGKELKNKSISAIILVLISIVIYIALVFRKLSRTLSPLIMGFAAIMALLHDVIIPLGVFSILGKFYGVEISAVFVAAILTILGYSVSDTVVVFDRVRENIIRGSFLDKKREIEIKAKDSTSNNYFALIVHNSIMQTLSRSINTTLTTLLSLFAIYFFGGESIRYFALALIIGIFLGAYSSIFVASPLLVWWSKNK